MTYDSHKLIAGGNLYMHNVAVDSKGNLYAGEIRKGNARKFVLKSALER